MPALILAVHRLLDKTRHRTILPNFSKFGREELYEKIWGLEAMGDNATVAVHINRLREKIEPDPAKPRYIQTVWGAGYRFRGQ